MKVQIENDPESQQTNLLRKSKENLRKSKVEEVLIEEYIDDMEFDTEIN
jgi:hypothetical protein